VLTVVACVVLAAVALVELILRCKTTIGVGEKRFKHDAEWVDVSR
jgi:hypothetical protein